MKKIILLATLIVATGSFVSYGNQESATNDNIIAEETIIEGYIDQGMFDIMNEIGYEFSEYGVQKHFDDLGEKYNDFEYTSKDNKDGDYTISATNKNKTILAVIFKKYEKIKVGGYIDSIVYTDADGRKVSRKFKYEFENGGETLYVEDKKVDYIEDQENYLYENFTK